MKKIKLLLGSLFLLMSIGTAHAWEITNFEVTADIEPNGKINITEVITTDFRDNLEKHGIYRFVPLGKRNSMPISKISVTDETGVPRMFMKSIENNQLYLKIGSPDKFVSGTEIYKIHYTIDRVIKDFPENNFSEFYWNVTGSKWETVIKKASLKVILPTKSSINETRCFTGPVGSRETDCQVSETTNGAPIFMTNRPLSSSEGFTVVYGFDKGMVLSQEVKPPAHWKQVLYDMFQKIKDFFALVIGFLLIPVKFIVYNLFRLMSRQEALIIPPILAIFKVMHKYRELKSNSPIIPKYNPPKGIHPAQIGSIIDSNFDKRDFIACIVSLAVKGALEITHKDFEGESSLFLKKNSIADKNLSEIDLCTYNYLFSAPTKDPTGIFLKEDPERIYSLFQSLQGKSKNDKHFKIIFGRGVGQFSFWFGFILFWGASIYASIYLWFIWPFYASLWVGFIIFIYFYPRRTKEGYQLLHEAKCYRLFLKTASIDQFETNIRKAVFEKHLPYAIALGVTKKWTSIFSDAITMPDFLAMGDIESLTRNISSSIPSGTSSGSSSSDSSGFSSSGSSGGGSGGGGGGSW